MATGTSSSRTLVPKTLEQLPTDTLLLEEQIRQRAHQIWLQNGSPSDTNLRDWLEAENELIEEHPQIPVL